MWNRDVDRTTDPAWLDDIAQLLCVPTERLLATTLEETRRQLDRAPERQRDTPLLLSAGVFHRKRRLHGLQYCPECLDERLPYYRTEWRLAFNVMCPRHNRPLRDACPACDAPIVPHRINAFSLDLCHACSFVLSRGREKLAPPAMNTVMLQRDLGAILSGMDGYVGPWRDAAAFSGVRTLIGVARNPFILRDLRRALDLSDPGHHGIGAARFEHARLAERMLVLETVARWIADWPASFRLGADAAGLTQRTFRRSAQPDGLREEVLLLPDGVQRKRAYMPILQDKELARLRRRDPGAYRNVRARRLIVKAGS